MKYAIDDKNTIAVLVKQLRREQNMTQQQLAEKAGVSFSFVNQVERGKETVRLDAVNKVLQVFGYAMAPRKTLDAFTAQSAWGALQIDDPSPLYNPVEAVPTQPLSVETLPEPSPQTSRRNNDWAFYK